MKCPTCQLESNIDHSCSRSIALEYQRKKKTVTDALRATEFRPLVLLESRNGAASRRHELVLCPFCQAEVWTVKWSRHGSGKKCPCGALLGGTQAMRKLG